jgi:hypothetical protein
MDPLRTTSIDLQFAAQLSPWWLLLILPPVLWLAWRLGHGRARAAGRVPAIALTTLRLAVVAALVVLLFRPSLVLREELTWPGRLVVLIDDSPSMQVADAALPESESLQLARSLGLIERPAPAGDIADAAGAAEEALRRLTRLPRPEGDDRAWWDQLETAGAAFAAAREAIVRGEAGAASWPEPARALLPAARAPLLALATAAEGLIAGQDPAPGTVQRLAEALHATARAFAAIQARLDAAALAGDAALAAAVRQVRSKPRGELAVAMLERSAPLLASRPSGLAVQQVRLSALAPAAGETDLHGALRRLVGEDLPQPLAAVVVLGDGRDTAGTSSDGLARAFAARGAMLSAVTVGGEAEPADLAITALSAPPVAVAGRPLTVHATLKAALAAPAEVRVRLEQDGGQLAERTIALPAGSGLHEVALTATLTGDGLRRLAVSVAAVPGEAVPAANNRRETAVLLRAEPLRVLVADQRPRWQTRFIATTLGRLPFCEVNLVVATANDGGRPPRGSGRGAWPGDDATLRLYDLVVLGPWPEDLLTAGEWRALRTLVESDGRTLWLIGDGTTTLPGGSELLPFPPRSAPTPLADLALTTLGTGAPFTRGWAAALPVLPASQAIIGLRPDTVAFAARADGTPVLAARRAGRGLIMQLDGDRLWQRLNPQAYDAHAATVAALAELAAAAALADTSAPRPWLAATDASTGVQVLLPAGASGLQLAGGAVVPAHPAHPGSSVLMAEIPRLPPGEVELRVAGAASGTPLYVRDDGRELALLAADPAPLAGLAAATGGRSLALAELARLWPTLEPRERIERHERVWRLWDSAAVLAVLLALLALEWAWRKYAGLV